MYFACIGIGDPETCEYLGLEGLHDKGVLLLDMIIAEDVQESMHNQVGEMVFEALVEIDGLARHGFARHDDIAQKAPDRRKRLDLREGQHIGGAVLAPPFAVEIALLGIVGQDDREFGGAADLRRGPGKGGQNGAFGKGLGRIGPGVIIAQDGNLEGNGQRRPPSDFCWASSRRAVSAS